MTENKVYIPPAFGKQPETPQEALLAAAALLEEEGRWREGEWYSHDHPEMEEYQDNPYCNGWGACADGALQIVTVGLHQRHEGSWDGDEGYVQGDVFWTYSHPYVYPTERSYYNPNDPNIVYSEARDLTDDLLRRMPPYRGLEQYNDDQGRDAVVALLRKAADGSGHEDVEGRAAPRNETETVGTSTPSVSASPIF